VGSLSIRIIFMGDDPKHEPLEGFHIADYGAATETVTISVHRYLLKDERQREALAKQFIEAISSGPSVRVVVAVARDEPPQSAEDQWVDIAGVTVPP